MLRDRLAQVEEALTTTEALDGRKRALALSANDAARAWSGFASRPGYGAALARHDVALREDIVKVQAPAMAATFAAVQEFVRPLPADTCRIWGIVAGGAEAELSVIAIKPGGAALARTTVAAGGQYILDTRCTDKSVTLEIRDRADRLLLQDGAPLALREGTMIERNFLIDRCGDLVPDRPGGDSNLRKMPDVLGKPAQDAEAQIAKIGRFALRFKEMHDPADKGRVIAQDPAAGDTLAADTSIMLTLSRGPVPDTKMPDLIGKTTDAARKLLVELPFAELGLDYVDDPDNAGLVVRQDPAANTPIGADVRILLCVGQAQRMMPDVTGQTEESARQRLVPAIVDKVAISYSAKGKTPGIVIDQDPAAGKAVAPGTEVRLIVAQKSDDSPKMPDLRGLTRRNAQAVLGRQGDFKITTLTGPDAVAKGSVFAQDPAAGSALTGQVDVTIHVSTGPQDDLRLPNLVGLTEKQARDALIPRYADTMKVTTVSTDKPAGTVVGQSPKAGTTITHGDPITLEIASPDTDRGARAMPDLHGLTATQAQKALKQIGITAVTFDAAEARRRNWQVVRQQPAAGRMVETSQEVRLKFGPRT
ncbi:PASTA domain-containing protein [Yoonia vestfoldensis]|uniref:PASTA domain-containing protein n=1 Tax=Yoonia vestfoldensis TaxID=245188 RepID=UPI00035D78BC|nr:Stk1 family PASTA domain-containing Ser/Thr kinase [Yoonia vestfoldensis]